MAAALNKGTESGLQPEPAVREILVRGVGGAVRRRLHKGMIAEQTINRIFMAGWAALALALLIGSWGTMRLARCAAQGNTPRTTAPEPVRPAPDDALQHDAIIARIHARILRPCSADSG